MTEPDFGGRVVVPTRPVNLHRGPDALAALVSADYGGDACPRVIYVFQAKRADQIKLIWWDGAGLCPMANRLEQGGFKSPVIKGGVMRLPRPTQCASGRIGLAASAWRSSATMAVARAKARLSRRLPERGSSKAGFRQRR